MWYFDNDYLESAHPMILRRLSETNSEQTPGYGEDDYRNSARRTEKSEGAVKTAPSFR